MYDDRYLCAEKDAQSECCFCGMCQCGWHWHVCIGIRIVWGLYKFHFEGQCSSRTDMAQIRSLCVVTPREGNPGGFTATEPISRAQTSSLRRRLGLSCAPSSTATAPIQLISLISAPLTARHRRQLEADRQLARRGMPIK